MNLFTESSNLKAITLCNKVSDIIDLRDIQSSNEKFVFPEEVMIVKPTQPLNNNFDYRKVERLFVQPKYQWDYMTSQIVLHIQKSANHLKLLKLVRLDLDDLGSIQFCDLLRWMKQNCEETQRLLDVFIIQTA